MSYDDDFDTPHVHHLYIVKDGAQRLLASVADDQALLMAMLREARTTYPAAAIRVSTELGDDRERWLMTLHPGTGYPYGDLPF